MSYTRITPDMAVRINKEIDKYRTAIKRDGKLFETMEDCDLRDAVLNRQSLNAMYLCGIEFVLEVLGYIKIKEM